MTKTLEKNQTERQMISGEDIAPVMQENTTNQSDPEQTSEKNQQQY